MREVFQQELAEVQERLVEIAGLVAVAIDNATRAFNESNVSLAEIVIDEDTKIDEAAIALDEDWAERRLNIVVRDPEALSPVSKLLFDYLGALDPGPAERSSITNGAA